LGRSVEEVLIPPEVRATDEEALRWALDATRDGHAAVPFEVELVTRQGRRIPTEVSLVAVTDAGSVSLKAFIRDITDRKTAEAQLIHQALTDALTGLPNRALLQDRLAGALSRRERAPGQLGVFFLDLDRFKQVNDSLGHEKGDELLVVLAERMRSMVRPDDTVARFGGDEFVIITENLSSVDEAAALGERLIAGISRTVVLGGHALQPGVSIGVTVASGKDASAEGLLREADVAMYRAKDKGGLRCELFHAGMLSGALLRRTRDGATHAP
jgi:diguanylate cyclase (GGDEF)-like protein